MNYYSGYPGLQQTGIIWVQGEAAAKSYLVAPNSTVPLWDSEKTTIYLKSADASGMPSMRVLDYTIRDETQKQDYATKDDLKALADEIRSELKKLAEAENE